LYLTDKMIYIDKPVCIDSSDRLPTDAVNGVCSDLGESIPFLDRCSEEKFMNHCPVTCQTCCEDSKGFLLKNKSISACKHFHKRQCNLKVSAFCPLKCKQCELAPRPAPTSTLTSPTPTPTPLPSPSPTAPRTPVPTIPNPPDPTPTQDTSDSASCSDPSVRFRLFNPVKNTFITRDCTWVQNKPYRCAWDGVSSMCPFVCNKCASAGTDSTSNFNFNYCQDGELRFKVKINDQKRTRDCSWVRNKSTNMRCKLDGVSSVCRETCGTCNAASTLDTQ